MGAVVQSHSSKAASALRKVIFTERDLLAAQQLLDRIRQASEFHDVGPPGDIRADFGESAEHNVSSDRNVLAEKARAVLFNRRHRARLFRREMFGEPAWELLLVLYVGDYQSDRRHTIGSLVEAAGVRMTTALRWLDFLEGERLIQRRDHPTDRRVVFIELSDQGRRALDAYFSGTR